MNENGKIFGYNVGLEVFYSFFARYWKKLHKNSNEKRNILDKMILSSIQTDSHNSFTLFNILIPSHP